MRIGEISHITYPRIANLTHVISAHVVYLTFLAADRLAPSLFPLYVHHVRGVYMYVRVLCVGCHHAREIRGCVLRDQKKNVSRAQRRIAYAHTPSLTSLPDFPLLKKNFVSARTYPLIVFIFLHVSWFGNRKFLTWRRGKASSMILLWAAVGKRNSTKKTPVIFCVAALWPAAWYVSRGVWVGRRSANPVLCSCITLPAAHAKRMR
ncbi:uncharacterized protein GGS22DRAFT_144018 [Annulohypoxylon maeteangense]|uniref:uncharacterized protein n=1 Tax=Annulohypoxylon maeteangense TaxID=1927788 RepID=UPI002007E68E|nr:uncharacterized protein GGS22DRAFT_144018 [Annulohypoxylon maeteangense]KAI0884546.1 hypothetical protein GGS22DRAFT_144018 [Annulohypoxylon maeteangense]